MWTGIGHSAEGLNETERQGRDRVCLLELGHPSLPTLDTRSPGSPVFDFTTQLVFESQALGSDLNYKIKSGSPACRKQTVGLLGLYNNPEIINSVQVGVLTNTGSRREVWVIQVEGDPSGSCQVERGV